jgi:hypothetical protein
VLVVVPQVTTVGHAGMQLPRSSRGYALLDEMACDIVGPARRTVVHVRQVHGLVGKQHAIPGRPVQELKGHEHGWPSVEFIDPAVGGAVPDQQHDIDFVQQPLGSELVLCLPCDRFGPGLPLPHQRREPGHLSGRARPAPRVAVGTVVGIEHVPVGCFIVGRPRLQPARLIRDLR